MLFLRLAMPTTKPNEEVVNSLKARLILHVCIFVYESVRAYSRPMSQEFFNGMMRMDDGNYRAKRPKLYTLKYKYRTITILF